MLTDILKFIKGYLIIRVTGYSPERFLNLCGRHGIVLWELRNRKTEYEMCISISGFRKLRPLVRKTKTKVVILERHGLPFILHRYRRRKLFAMGALAAAGLTAETEHTQVKIGFTCPKETSDLNLFVNMTKLNGIQIDAMNLMTENGIQKVTMTLDGKITDAGMSCLLCQIGKEAEEFRILELFGI